MKTKSEATKNLAASIKRAATVLRSCATDLKDLRDKDRQALEEAARILSTAGRVKTSEAHQLKDKEDRLERADQAARAAAAKIMENWPVADVADKVALVLATRNGGRLYDNLRVYTVRGYEYRPTATGFESILSDARREIISAAAYGAVYRVPTDPVAETMAAIRTKIDAARVSTECESLAERWRVVLVQERLEKANSRAVG